MKRVCNAIVGIAVALYISCASAFAGATIINSHPDKKYGKPIPFKKVDGTKGSIALEISGGRLYALEKDGLSVYNIDDPKNPKLKGFVGGMGNVRQLKVRGKTAFLSSRQNGLWAVDVSDENNPKIISNFDTIEMATGLDVVGDLAVLGLRVYGVQCVDVSNPAKMKHLSSILTDESQSVIYRDGLIFSGDWAGGEITIIDAHDLLNLKVVSKLKLDGYGDGLEVRGKYLYASTGQHKKSGPEELRNGSGHGLEIWDISDIKNPVRISRSDFPRFYFGPCDYWTPRVCGDYVFASDTINGLFLVDASDKSKQKIVGNLVLPKCAPDNPKMRPPFFQIRNPKVPQGDPLASMAVGDGVLYMAGNFTGIYIAEFPDIARIESNALGALPTLPKNVAEFSHEGFVSSGEERVNPIRAVAVDGDIVYAANVWGGLKVFRVSDGKIEHIDTVKIRYAADVKKSGDKLVVAEGFDGIGIYKIEGAGKIREIGRHKSLECFPDFAQFVWAFDGCDTIACSAATSEVFFVDISNPAATKSVGRFKGGQLLYDNYASQTLAKNRFFALARHCGGLMIFDVSKNPVELTVYDKFPMCSQTGSVAGFGDKFMAIRCGGYAFVDPEHFVPIQQMDRRAFPDDKNLGPDVPDASNISRSMFPKSRFEGQINCDVKTGKVAVANRMTGDCHTYDFSNPDSPKPLKHYIFGTNPNVPSFVNGKVLVPCGYAGLLLEK